MVEGEFSEYFILMRKIIRMAQRAMYWGTATVEEATTVILAFLVHSGDDDSRYAYTAAAYIIRYDIMCHNTYICKLLLHFSIARYFRGNGRQPTSRGTAKAARSFPRASFDVNAIRRRRIACHARPEGWRSRSTQ